MMQLHRSIASLDGTAYLEFLPGRFNGDFWGASSVFLDEDAFAFIEPVFMRLVPNYDHYSVMEIERACWSSILEELDRLVRVLGNERGDADLEKELAWYLRHTYRAPVVSRVRLIADVSSTVKELTAWLRGVLAAHDCVSLLGL